MLSNISGDITPRAARPSPVTSGSPFSSFLNVHSTYPPGRAVPSSIYSPYLRMKLPVATRRQITSRP